MRSGAGLGLLGLLIAVFILVFIWSKHASVVVQKGEEAKETVEPITNRGPDGVSAPKSVDSTGDIVNGQLRSITITSVTAGGYFDQYYGLQPGDKIVKINGDEVGAYNEAETALGMIQSRPITILRKGKEMTINCNNGASGSSGAAPATPSGGSGIPGLPSSIQVPKQ